MSTARANGVILTTSACFLLVTALVLNATPAGADPITFSGSTSIEIATPGNMDLWLEIDGEIREFKSVDDSLNGTLTLAWAASQTEPRTTVQSCDGGAPGGGISLEEATSATVWATWTSSSPETSPSSQAFVGPAQVSGDGPAGARLCLADDSGGSEAGGGQGTGGTGDPTGGGQSGDPTGGGGQAGGDPTGGQGGGEPTGGDPTGGQGGGDPVPPCSKSNGNGHGNGNANGNGGGNGNGNAYGHACH